MKTKVLLILAFAIIPLISISQITPDSLIGTYVGQKWYMRNSDANWTITPDTAYILTVDTNLCTITTRYSSWFPSGTSRLETLYNFCTELYPNWFSRFYSDDSLKIIYDNVSFPPPDNYIIWSTRFYGKKISSKILSIKESIKKDVSVEIYPNPFNEYIRIKNNGMDNCLINVFSITGKLLETKTIEKLEEKQINTVHLKNGVFIIQIISSTGLESFKFVKNN